MNTYYSVNFSRPLAVGNLEYQGNATPIWCQACKAYGNTRLFTILFSLFFLSSFGSIASERIENDRVLFTNSSITLSYTAKYVKCYGEKNGSIDLTVKGGASPYKYKWSNGKTSQDISGLGAGSYTVTVTDKNGKKATKTCHIGQPAALALTVATTNISCSGGATGEIQASASGGKVAYTFKLKKNGSEIASNGSGTFTGLTEGSYTVKVVDANGCYKEKSATITKSPTFVITEIIREPKCYGEKGKITITATGVTGTPSYSIDGGVTFKPGNEFNVVAGDYTICVKDSKTGCVVCKDVEVEQPELITFNAVVTPIACYGGTASITITDVEGGTGKLSDFEYSRNGGNTWTANNVFNNFDPGTYSICVRDKPECVVCKDVVITQPALLVATATETDITCFGASDGTVSSSVTGGTAPFDYTLTRNGVFVATKLDQGTTSSFTGLTPGDYTITVTDANGCTDASNVVIVTQPAELVLSTTDTDVLCNGGSNGTITATPAGGTGPYDYRLINLTAEPDVITSVNNVAAGYTFTGLAAATYRVRVIDANGCIDVVNNIVVSQPASPLTVTIAQTNLVIAYSVNVNPAGGTPGYTYLWNDGSTAEVRTILFTDYGTYSVTVTDANGCTVSTTFTVPPSAPALVTDATARKGIEVTSEGVKLETHVKAYPNPFSSNANIEFSVDRNTHALLEVYSLTGVKVATLYNNQADAGKVYNVVFNGDKLRAGTYIYRLGTNYGVKNSKIMLSK